MNFWCPKKIGLQLKSFSQFENIEKHTIFKSCVFLYSYNFLLSILCRVWKCPLSSQLVCFLNNIFQYNDTWDKFVSKYYCDTFILRRGNKRRQNVTGLLCRHRVKRRHTLYVLSLCHPRHCHWHWNNYTRLVSLCIWCEEDMSLWLQTPCLCQLAFLS